MPSRYGAWHSYLMTVQPIPGGRAPLGGRTSATLKGVRLGACASVIGLIAAAIWQRRAHRWGVFVLEDREGAIGKWWDHVVEAWPFFFLCALALALVCGLVWWGLRRSDRLPRPGTVLRIVIVVGLLIPLGVALTLAGRWWQVLNQYGVNIGYLFNLAVAALALGFALISEAIIRRRPRAATPSGPRLVAAGVTVVAFAASALVPPQVLSPVQSRTIAAPSNVPQLPARVTGTVEWSREVSPYVDVAAGATGPLLMTGEGLEGLDPVDGSTLWSYRRTGAQFMGVGEDSDPRVITSPDRRYALISIWYPRTSYADDGRIIVILETATGRVVAERETLTANLEDGVVQVTDSVALIGREGVSLSDGSTLWRLPDPPMRRFSGTKAPHTLVVDQQCDEQSGTCSLTLADDADPTSTRRLSNVVVDPADDRIPGYGDDVVTLAQGWTVRRASPGGPDSPLEAISLDAAGTADEAQGVVALGTYGGPDRATSGARIALRPVIPERAPGAEDGSSPPAPAPVAVFDPATRSLTEVSVGQDWDTSLHRPSWPTPDTGVPRWSIPDNGAPDDLGAGYLELGRVDGSSGVPISPAGALLGKNDTAHNPFAVAAPGIVVVGVEVSTDFEKIRGGHDQDRSRTILYGVE